MDSFWKGTKRGLVAFALTFLFLMTIPVYWGLLYAASEGHATEEALFKVGFSLALMVSMALSVFVLIREPK
jgi:hypothetical protein